jgi:hypothetical protein
VEQIFRAAFRLSKALKNRPVYGKRLSSGGKMSHSATGQYATTTKATYDFKFLGFIMPKH